LALALNNSMIRRRQAQQCEQTDIQQALLARLGTLDEISASDNLQRYVEICAKIRKQEALLDNPQVAPDCCMQTERRIRILRRQHEL